MYFYSKKLLFELLFVNCKMKIASLKQLFYNLLNELLLHSQIFMSFRTLL